MYWELKMITEELVPTTLEAYLPSTTELGDDQREMQSFASTAVNVLFPPDL